MELQRTPKNNVALHSNVTALIRPPVSCRSRTTKHPTVMDDWLLQMGSPRQQQDDDEHVFSRTRTVSTAADFQLLHSPSSTSATNTQDSILGRIPTESQLDESTVCSTRNEHILIAASCNNINNNNQDNGLDYWMSLTEGPGFPEIDTPDSGTTGNDGITTNQPVSVSSLVPKVKRTVPKTIHLSSSRNSFVNDQSRYTTTEDSVLTATTFSSVDSETTSLSEHAYENRPDTRSNIGDSLANQLANCSGKFQAAEDGHIRYFGASSNLHLLHNRPFSLWLPKIAPL